MVQYIDWLSANCHGEPLLLVLDVYKAHRTAKLRQRARELNAELLFVPAGGTSLYQPLDRRVFGELKSRARHAFGQLASRTGIHRGHTGGSDRNLDQLLGRDTGRQHSSGLGNRPGVKSR
jgi:hypothetical protein